MVFFMLHPVFLDLVQNSQSFDRSQCSISSLDKIIENKLSTIRPLRTGLKADNTNDGFATDSESGTRLSVEDFYSIWTVASKVKGSIPNGYRLENLSWRLWHKTYKQQRDLCANRNKQSHCGSETEEENIAHPENSNQVINDSIKHNISDSNDPAQKGLLSTIMPQKFPITKDISTSNQLARSQATELSLLNPAMRNTCSAILAEIQYVSEASTLANKYSNSFEYSAASSRISSRSGMDISNAPNPHLQSKKAFTTKSTRGGGSKKKKKDVDKFMKKYQPQLERINESTTPFTNLEEETSSKNNNYSQIEEKTKGSRGISPRSNGSLGIRVVHGFDIGTLSQGSGRMDSSFSSTDALMDYNSEDGLSIKSERNHANIYGQHAFHPIVNSDGSVERQSTSILSPQISAKDIGNADIDRSSNNYDDDADGDGSSGKEKIIAVKKGKELIESLERQEVISDLQLSGAKSSDTRPISLLTMLLSRRSEEGANKRPDSCPPAQHPPSPPSRPEGPVPILASISSGETLQSSMISELSTEEEKRITGTVKEGSIENALEGGRDGSTGSTGSAGDDGASRKSSYVQPSTNSHYSSDGSQHRRRTTPTPRNNGSRPLSDVNAAPLYIW